MMNDLIATALEGAPLKWKREDVGEAAVELIRNLDLPTAKALLRKKEQPQRKGVYLSDRLQLGAALNLLCVMAAQGKISERELEDVEKEPEDVQDSGGQ